MKFSKKELIIISIITLLTIVDALSIDLYLPAFKSMSDYFNTDNGKVQITVSIFLAGFAVGQLLWGPLSDRFGRKIPILASILIYTASSFLVVKAASIEQVWVYRFIQAFCASAGVVISRAVVIDFFDRKQTVNVFTVLSIAYGVSPIIAPSLGNLLLKYSGWHGSFIAMGIFGVVLIPLVAFGLPETRRKENTADKKIVTKRTVLNSYLYVFKNSQFCIYTLIGSMAYAGMMVYITNSPFLLMEKGGLTGMEYAIVFAVNSVGMMAAAYSISLFLKKFTVRQIIKYASFAALLISLILGIAVWIDAPTVIILILLFLYLLPISMLFPTTTDLVLNPFTNDSGTSSAIFGFAQLALSFAISAIVGFVQNNSALPMATALIICAFTGYFYSIFYKMKA